MEQELKIRTRDKKSIYGTLRGSLQKPIVIFVHGLTGDRNEHQFFNGARYLERHGFSSFRFNLYGWQSDARKLHYCTLRTHAEDLDRVIDYFRKRGVRKLFVVGHSYGGKTILASVAKNYDAVVLWEPSHRTASLFRTSPYLRTFDGYLELEETAYGFLVGAQMVKGEKRSKVEEKIREVRVPVKIIAAGRGVLVRGARWYYRMANRPKALVIVPNASHCFDEEGTEERLLRETVGWFKRFR